MHTYLDVDILQTDTDRLVVSSFTMRLDTVNEVVKVRTHFLCALVYSWVQCVCEYYSQGR